VPEFNVVVAGREVSAVIKPTKASWRIARGGWDDDAARGDRRADPQRYETKKGPRSGKDKIRINEKFLSIAVRVSGHGGKRHVRQSRPGWKDIGVHKELIEEHSLCAGCPESMAFRYILASLPAPEDTVMVGSTGCTSLVFPMVAVHNIHSLFGNQNAIATGLKRALTVRFPNKVKDVVVLAGDGATVDIGLDMTLQAWFRQERFTTICFDNELYANTGGQESGLMQKGFVAKMAPMGKKFDKVRLPEIARESGCHYVVNMTVSQPGRVEKVIKNAVYIAREIGPTYLQLYTPCILRSASEHGGAAGNARLEKPTERFA
jgi:pyruvate ferredoxin oxidoreductase beta subunit